MNLTFLGTGTSQGIPMVGCGCRTCRSADPRDKRLRTSAMLEANGATLVVDAGPDFRAQMLRENVKRLDAILLTHEHTDHIGGLDDVRAFNYFMSRPMPLYAEERVQRQVRKAFAYAFDKNKYPGSPEIEQITIYANQPFEVQGVRVLPVRTMHAQLPVLGFRVGGLAYITDTNFVSRESKRLLEGCEVLVVNALRREPHLSHFTLGEALRLIEELKPARAYLTHVSHQLGLYAELQPTLPSNVQLACDGLKIAIG
ncbi:MAG: MBL fold metallo-hydrolase [Prevotellaceae bacterium]|jgi:phosphoribosyl 1,2-cyclic phosphate phosphodiesterase|nr:MBL fold metallo-hydrolase [Prevotellaceae bacterium]